MILRTLASGSCKPPLRPRLPNDHVMTGVVMFRGYSVSHTCRCLWLFICTTLTLQVSILTLHGLALRSSVAIFILLIPFSDLIHFFTSLLLFLKGSHPSSGCGRNALTIIHVRRVDSWQRDPRKMRSCTSREVGGGTFHCLFLRHSLLFLLLLPLLSCGEQTHQGHSTQYSCQH